MNQTSSALSKSKKIELVIQQLNTLPTLPSVAARLLQITVRSDTQATEVVQLIESDPALASRIIALATRASTGVSKRAATLSKAVVLLGFDAVRNAVLSIKVFEALEHNRKDGDQVFDRTGFWKHSLAVACASKLLMPHVDSRIDPEEAFICGLLHDLGKIVLDTALPKSFNRIVQLTEASMANIADVERKVLGVDHTVVGRRLAEKWSLPDSIVETIWLHHQWMQGLPESVNNVSIIQTVKLADSLVRQQRIGYSGNHAMSETAEEQAAAIGCPRTVLEEVARQLPEAISERACFMGLDEIEPEDLYFDALGEANTELGRLNNKLQEQNKRLQIRSRYLDLLGKLDESIQAGHTVCDVCSLVCRLWGEHSNAQCCAVYSYGPNDVTIEGAVAGAPHEEPTIFLVDREDQGIDDYLSDPQTDLPRGFAVVPVDVTHQWFFEQVGPTFQPDMTLMMPLRMGTELVGAILWQDIQSNKHYQDQIKEIQAFATAAALAIAQAQKQQKQSRLCEQLAQSNLKLHKAQLEVIQKRCLAAVGEMACGAAHEINNPLAVIVGRSQLLASGEEDPKRKQTLENISRQGDIISEIIKDLLEFARPAEPQPSQQDVAEVVRSATNEMQESAQAENVTFDINLEDDLPDIYVDQQQILVALKELFSNAIDAYEGNGGEIHIGGYFDEVDENVIIEIIDRGCGMDKETLDKAADPFFSAKQAGRRRGLGLSRCIRNIEVNGGRLAMDSEPGRGTRVRIILLAAIGDKLQCLEETANESL